MIIRLLSSLPQCCQTIAGGLNPVLHVCKTIAGGLNPALHVCKTPVGGLNPALHICKTPIEGLNPVLHACKTVERVFPAFCTFPERVKERFSSLSGRFTGCLSRGRLAAVSNRFTSLVSVIKNVVSFFPAKIRYIFRFSKCFPAFVRLPPGQKT